MDGDGKEYEPVFAEQFRQWVALADVTPVLLLLVLELIWLLPQKPDHY